MTALTHDARRPALGTGLAFALLSAASFGMSGSLAKGLMESGWTAGAAVLVRVAIAAAVLAVPGALALRGRWHLLRSGAGTIIGYGLFAVAGAQLCYFLAVASLDVGVALLIEYLAPVMVVLWLWVRRGSRPSRLTVVGAAIAALGLVLLLDVLGGAHVSVVGIGWALAAMVGATVYFILSGNESNPLPPISLAAAALVVATVALGAAAVLGVLPVAFSTRPVHFVSFDAPWWAVLVVLGVVTAALAYVVGIAAVRRLGPRLGSFVALAEVISAATFAWILLGQAPRPVQLVGAALVLAGVIVVKVGEPRNVSASAAILDAPPAPVPV